MITNSLGQVALQSNWVLNLEDQKDYKYFK